MKAYPKPFPKTTIIAMMMLGSLLSQALLNLVKGQAPDCATGTVMYALFNDSTGATTNAPSEIRSVNYATGAVGPILGGSFLIQKAGAGGPYYGSAGMGLDAITGRFFLMTQMSSGAGLQKDIISRNTATSTTVVIGTTPGVVT